MEKQFELREYQHRAQETVLNELKKNVKRQMLVMATGLGKTYVAVQICLHFERVLFVAHREELIDQAVENLEMFYPLQVGIVKGPRFEGDRRVVVASVQTITNRLDKFRKDEFDIIVLDEVHHYMAATYVRVAQYFEPKLLLGLTATPHRLDGLSLGNIMDKIVFDYGIDKGVKDGWLCELDAFRIRTGADLSAVKRTAGDFNLKELAVTVNSEQRNKLIVEKYQKYCEGRQALVFAVDVNHAVALCKEFQLAGYNANFVVSDEELTPERKKVVADFKAGRIQIMVNVNILTEGFDHLDIGCIIMARPTESLTLYIQCIGRGTRLKTQRFIEEHGKNNCIILDFVDNSGRHQLINTWELDKQKRIEDRVFMGAERKAEAIKQREEHIRQITMKAGADKKVNLLALPEIRIHKDRGAFRDNATEKQLAWLKSEGVYVEGNTYTKGQASEYITNFAAKEWMLIKLRQWGYDISNNPTVGQYYQVKAILESQVEEKEHKPPKMPFKNDLL